MRLKRKLKKPKSGLAQVVHTALLIALPVFMYVFVRIDFPQAALALILLSKWRMFAVKPRHWTANIRANAVDLTVGIGTLIFMVHGATQAWLLAWALFYGIWLLFIKPSSSMPMVTLQAALGQTIGLMALYLNFSGASSWLLVLLTWLVCYASARHFFTSFEESLAPLLSYAWGYFAGALAWLLSHWLLFYGVIAQPTLILSVIGLGLATLYYLDKTDRLSPLLRRQFIFVMVAVIAIVLAFSDWGDKTV